MKELDKQIATEVMGDTIPQVWADASVGPSQGDAGGYRMGIKPYSTDIVAAMEVVDKIGTHFQLRRLRSQLIQWQAAFGFEPMAQWVTAETAPLAICLAALAFIEKREK